MIELRDAPFGPWQLLAAHERAGGHAGCGGTAVFVGTMRDFNEGDEVTAMHLEHYPGMTERHLQQICDEAHARWPVLDVLIVHRYGDILPGEPIVLVAAWAAHRGPAFEACRHLIESLKSRAPFWKRETLDAGQPRWVARNTPA